MLFIVEVPDEDFNQTCQNRQTVGARMRQVLQESSPSEMAIVYPWNHEEEDWGSYVFHRVKVKALPRDVAAAVEAIKS